MVACVKHRRLHVDPLGGAPKRVSFTVPETMLADLDPGLARNLLLQLLGNTWKFVGKKTLPVRPFRHILSTIYFTLSPEASTPTA